MIHTGDCVEVMAGMPEASVDAIVTDPPYGLEFMGKEWDRLWRTDQTGPSRREGRFAGQVRWLGNGEPTPRYEAGPAAQSWHQQWATAALRVAKPGAYLLAFGGTRTVHRLTVALEDAGWIIRDLLVWAYAQGFPKSRSSLKPAWEPIVLARKPGPLRELGIDAARIGTEVETWPATRRQYDTSGIQPGGGTGGHTDATGEAPAGRWPSNVLLSPDAPIFDGGWEGVVGDSPGFSRFFCLPKASRSDREPVFGGLEVQPFAQSTGARAALARGEAEYQGPDASTGLNRVKHRVNVHPTVKSLALMRHLCRLVVPPGGTVLDPFLGSGTTAIAAEMEGFAWVGIEKDESYVAIAEARLQGVQRGMGLTA